MTYDENLLASREELAKMILLFFESKSEAKKSGKKDDWADHFQIGRELREQAVSILYFDNLKNNERP